MVSRRAFLALLLTAAASSAAAMSLGVGLGVDTQRSSGGGALDALAQPAGAYSFRKLKSNYAGPSAKIRRTTGGTSDIGFAASGDFDTTAATTFCAATTCFVDTWYDQSGNARHITNATPANQPPLVFNCIGDKPCFGQAADFRYLQYLTGFAVTATQSYSVVQKRTGAAGTCQFATNTPNSFLFTVDAAPNTWRLEGVIGGFNATAADGAWHAAAGVLNGGASVLRIDQTETTGTAAAGVGAGASMQLQQVAAGGCGHTEMVFWGAYALTPAERVALTDNQRNYWIPAPLDTFATPSGAYSFRKLKSTYSGPAIRIRRNSDQAETDINFLGFTSFTGAPIDVAAANAHCAATTCFIKTWYDQSGNARDATQATAANQPALVFNCQNTLPCARTTTATQVLLTASFTPTTGKQSLSAVAMRPSLLFSYCYPISMNNGSGNQIFINNGTAEWALTDTAAYIVPPAADGVWHAMTGVINGASPASMVNIDGVEITGSLNGITLGGATAIGLKTGVGTCNFGESIFWDAYPLTAAERTVLINNQRNFWGF
jgi:hypothetical protein